MLCLFKKQFTTKWLVCLYVRRTVCAIWCDCHTFYPDRSAAEFARPQHQSDEAMQPMSPLASMMLLLIHFRSLLCQRLARLFVYACSPDSLAYFSSAWMSVYFNPSLPFIVGLLEYKWRIKRAPAGAWKCRWSLCKHRYFLSFRASSFTTNLHNFLCNFFRREYKASRW